jgi:hypothetical protein
MPHEINQASIDAIVNCAIQCEHCADECIGNMPDCARLCRDCSQMCWTIASFMSRGSNFIEQVSRACIDICEACAKEGETHDNPHCQKCAEACRQSLDVFKKISSVAAGR